jgi:hypothetical protein
MANVVRLVNGGTIQVRTGALQGVGPEGQRGVAGPAGADGPQGVQGETGPIGQIINRQGLTKTAQTIALPLNTDTLINFGSVSYDDFSCFATGNTNIVLTQAGDYQLSCMLRFDDGPNTSREIWFMVGSTLIARDTRNSISGAPYYMNLVCPYRAAAGEIVNVYARAGTATQIQAGFGQLLVTRTGSGPVGPQGPAGDRGPQGIQGIQGDKGDPGNANSGFATYAGMLPH